MKKLTGNAFAKVLRSPVVLITAALGMGASMATVVLGIPSLWSAEAAGWAAALGTTAAAVVALYVGLAPHAATRAAHVLRAQAIGLIVYARLTGQYLRLEAARRLSLQTPMDSVLFGLIKETLSVNPAFADALLPYADALSDTVASGIAAAVADLESSAPLLVTHGLEAHFQSQRIARVLEPVCRSLNRARVRLAPFATRKPAEDMEDTIEELVDGIVELYDEAMLLSPRF